MSNIRRTRFIKRSLNNGSNIYNQSTGQVAASGNLLKNVNTIQINRMYQYTDTTLHGSNEGNEINRTYSFDSIGEDLYYRIHACIQVTIPSDTTYVNSILIEIIGVNDNNSEVALSTGAISLYYNDNEGSDGSYCDVKTEVIVKGSNLLPIEDGEDGATRGIRIKISGDKPFITGELSTIVTELIPPGYTGEYYTGGSIYKGRAITKSGNNMINDEETVSCTIM